MKTPKPPKLTAQDQIPEVYLDMVGRISTSFIPNLLCPCFRRADDIFIFAWGDVTGPRGNQVILHAGNLTSSPIGAMFCDIANMVGMEQAQLIHYQTVVLRDSDTHIFSGNQAEAAIRWLFFNGPKPDGEVIEEW